MDHEKEQDDRDHEKEQDNRDLWEFGRWDDACRRQVLDELEAIGQADSTVVLFSSDHGEQAVYVHAALAAAVCGCCAVAAAAAAVALVRMLLRMLCCACGCACCCCTR